MFRETRPPVAKNEFEPAREKENVNPFREFYLDFLVTETEADRVAVLKQVIGKLEELIKKRGHLTEYEERYVNHVRRSIRNLDKKDKTAKILELNKKILEYERQGKENELREGKEAEFEDIFKGLSEKQITLLFCEADAIQFTKGCSIGCTRCGFNRLKDVRKNISWQAVLNMVDIFKRYGLAGEYREDYRPLSYFATDSADYKTRDGKKDMVDVNRLFLEEAGVALGNMSKVPEDESDQVRVMWEDPHSNLCLSVLDSHPHAKKVNRLLASWGDEEFNLTSFLRNHEGKELEYPIGHVYSGKSPELSITSSNGVVITPEGSFSFTATSVNPIYPDGYERSDIDKNTKFISKYESLDLDGEYGLDNYYLPFKVVDFHTGSSARLVHQSESQVVETILDQGFFSMDEEDLKERKTQKLVGSYENIYLRGFFNGNTYSSKFFQGDSDVVASFFLSEIKQYLLTHKREAIILDRFKRANPSDGLDVEKEKIVGLPDGLRDMVLLDGVDNWKKFQVMIYWLLQDPNNEIVSEFIKSHPAKFDPEAVKIVPDGEVEEEKKKEISLERMIEWFNFDLSLVRSLPAYVANQYESKGFVRMAVGVMLDRFEKISDVKPDDLAELKRISQLKRTDDNGTDEYGYRYVLAIMREYESRRLKSKE